MLSSNDVSDRYDYQVVTLSGFGGTDSSLSGLPQQVELHQPWSDFVYQRRVAACSDGGRSGYDFSEQSVYLVGGICVIVVLAEVIEKCSGVTDRLVAAVTVAVRSRIAIVLAERPECFGCFRQNITAGFYEIAFRVIGFHVPCIIGNSVKGYFGSFRPFHRVGYETGHGMRRIRIESVRRSHQQMVAAIVAYRKIPPDI